MDSRIRHLVAASLLLATGTQEGRATEPKTWYVYCEGESAEGHWAVFSENFWPHPHSADYGRLVGSVAKEFFESRHDLSLEGCAGVDFRDDSLAKHSRSLTVQLHQRMGDRIYFLRLPAEVLPATAHAASALATSDGQAADGQGWTTPTRPR